MKTNTFASPVDTKIDTFSCTETSQGTSVTIYTPHDEITSDNSFNCTVSYENGGETIHNHVTNISSASGTIYDNIDQYVNYKGFYRYGAGGTGVPDKNPYEIAEARNPIEETESSNV